MPTGYEVQMYVDIHRIREALERIADALESKVEGPPYTVEGCEHCAGCGELAWQCVCQETSDNNRKE